jgi:hypothetical protein
MRALAVICLSFGLACNSGTTVQNVDEGLTTLESGSPESSQPRELTRSTLLPILRTACEKKLDPSAIVKSVGTDPNFDSAAVNSGGMDFFDWTGSYDDETATATVSLGTISKDASRAIFWIVPNDPPNFGYFPCLGVAWMKDGEVRPFVGWLIVR